MEARFKIGDYIFIGCNSAITRGIKTPYVDHWDNEYFNLVGEEAVVLSEPWKEDVKLIGLDKITTWERIAIKLVSTGEVFSIYNGYHDKNYAAVMKFSESMHNLADELMELSDEMIAYSPNDFGC